MAGQGPGAEGRHWSWTSGLTLKAQSGVLAGELLGASQGGPQDCLSSKTMAPFPQPLYLLRDHYLGYSLLLPQED